VVEDQAIAVERVTGVGGQELGESATPWKTLAECPATSVAPAIRNAVAAAVPDGDLWL